MPAASLAAVTGYLGFASVSRGCASAAGVSFVTFDICFSRLPPIAWRHTIDHLCAEKLQGDSCDDWPQGRIRPEQLAFAGPFLCPDKMARPTCSLQAQTGCRLCDALCCAAGHTPRLDGFSFAAKQESSRPLLVAHADAIVAVNLAAGHQVR